MKLFLLINLNILFLISCNTAIPKEDDGEGEKGKSDQVESIRSQAKTALEEIELFQEQVRSIKSLSDNLSTKTTIANLEISLESQVNLASQSYRVVKSAVKQAENAVNEEEVLQAVKQAVSAKDTIFSARDKAKEIRDSIQALE